jgi:hypothetical protein
LAPAPARSPPDRRPGPARFDPGTQTSAPPIPRPPTHTPPTPPPPTPPPTPPPQVLGDRHVDLLKVDVEGFEPQVMAGAPRLLARRAVDNIIMEYSPHVAEKARK